jgi:hypothetical protein
LEERKKAMAGAMAATPRNSTPTKQRPDEALDDILGALEDKVFKLKTYKAVQTFNLK